jgi:hypothetical protein
MAKQKPKEVPPNEAGDVFVIATYDGEQFWRFGEWVDCWTQADQFRFGGPMDPYTYARQHAIGVMCSAKVPCHAMYVPPGTPPRKERHIRVEVAPGTDVEAVKRALVRKLLDDSQRFRQQMMQGRCDPPVSEAN